MVPQIIIFVILLATLVLFLWGRWRYDLVAAMALLAVALSGLIPPEEVFFGFSHPAVITVAAILVISQGLSNAGVVEKLAGWLGRVGGSANVQILSLTGLTALLSGFINDIGALGLLMPVAIRLVRRAGRSPSTVLMPLAFGSILGGLMTAIGTPPNIYIAAFRADVVGAPFLLLDFFPIGAGLVVSGVLFIGLLGWRLIPEREGQASQSDSHGIKEYLTEVRVPQGFNGKGKSLEEVLGDVGSEIVILAIARDGQPLPLPTGQDVLLAGDELILEADSSALEKLMQSTNFELVGKGDLTEEFLESRDTELVEAVVLPEALIVGQTPRELELRRRYQVNLLAISRQGRQTIARLADVRFRPGDVLLLQGNAGSLTQRAVELGCLPLGGEQLWLERPRRTLLTASIFALAILASALGLVQSAVAFATAAVLMILVGSVTLGEAYDSINWPIIALLGAMIPVGGAFEATGAADSLGNLLVQSGAQLPLAATVGIVLVVSMLMSNMINKSATTVLMAPVAVSVAQAIDGSPDPFLMAVAVGASAAFLTPIGHHCNTLVMGPGGYRFGDYWRMGLPVTILVIIVALPIILWFWPL
ncbi:MAG: SLC13 family permease [Chloroflexota bacterium]